MLLPSSTSKRDVYLEYERAVRGTGHSRNHILYSMAKQTLSHIPMQANDRSL